MNIHDIDELRDLQSMSLQEKELMTAARIHEWQYEAPWGIEKGVVSFSGGKDSTVLLHICRKLYPDIRAVFANTGLEYPEIQSFVRKQKNVDIVRPNMQFNEVISKYGYPLIGKEVSTAMDYARRIRADTHNTIYKRKQFLGIVEKADGEKSEYNKEKWIPLASKVPVRVSGYCCSVMKKQPIAKYTKTTGLYSIVAMMAEESRLRTQAWLKTGCNSFDGKKMSKPMSFWTEQDVLKYIKDNEIEIASVYGDIVELDEQGNEYDSTLIGGGKLKCTGCKRTGCIFCAFGFHNEKGETRFQRLARTHPRQYEYCMGGGQWVDNPDYDATAPQYDGEWENWNPKKIWVPSKQGLGMKVVFDMVNDIYGKDFYRYD